MTSIGPYGAASAGNPATLPPVPPSGTAIKTLSNPDEIFQAELAVVNETHPGQDLYIAQYTLPKTTDGASVGTPSSDAQRQLLGAIVNQIKYNNVHAFIIADNSAQEGGKPPDNQDTINYLKQNGAFILPYPTKYANIDHTKLIANNDYAVLTSANESAHMSDCPDDNTGFLFAGAAAHNGIVHSWLPQWNFSVKQDAAGWAKAYPAPNVDPQMLPDPSVTWLNTAPGAESGSPSDQIEIQQAYLKLIGKAATGPANAYLYLEHWDVTNKEVMEALIKAKKSNPTLDARIIMDPNQYIQSQTDAAKKGETSLAEVVYNELKQAGIQVKFANVNPQSPVPGDTRPQIFHDKWMAYNDQEVINGSGNMSFSSLGGNNPALTPDQIAHPDKSTHLYNREVDADVVDADAAKAYKQKFLSDWTGNSSDDAKTASTAGSKPAPSPTPQPQPQPVPGPADPNQDSNNGWSGYLNRLNTYSQGIDALFHLAPASPSPFGNPGGLNFGFAAPPSPVQLILNPFAGFLVSPTNLVGAPLQPWVQSSLSYLGPGSALV